MPIPKFTPIIAAKRTGLMPIFTIKGNNNRVHKRIPETSSINIPIIIINILDIINITYLLSEKLNNKSAICPGTSSITKYLLTIPVHLKFSGIDAIVVRGKSENPVYLFIDGDHAELRDATMLWGNVTGDSEKIIKKDLGREDVEIAQIGPGGENLVKLHV